MLAIGLIIEEHRAKIIDAWRAAAHPGAAPVLEYAIPVFVRELARSLRNGLPPRRAWDRCALLVRRARQSDPALVVREVAALRRVIWSVLRQHQRAVPPDARAEVDAILDDTMAALVNAITAGMAPEHSARRSWPAPAE